VALDAARLPLAIKVATGTTTAATTYVAYVYVPNQSILTDFGFVSGTSVTANATNYVTATVSIAGTTVATVSTNSGTASSSASSNATYLTTQINAGASSVADTALVRNLGSDNADGKVAAIGYTYKNLRGIKIPEGATLKVSFAGSGSTTVADPTIILALREGSN
jgi:hypothetical protein